MFEPGDEVYVSNTDQILVAVFIRYDDGAAVVELQEGEVVTVSAETLQPRQV